MSLERILVCAEPSTAERFADALRARGYDAETAGDRAAALTLTETTHPAIVLTWSNLPETEIVGFVQRLGELSPRPRVAVVIRDEDMERCGDLLEVGADALLLDDPEMAFLLSSLHRLGGGGLVVDPSLARALVARAGAGSRASELGSVGEVEDPPGGPGDAATEVRVVEFQDCDLAEIVRTSVAEAALAFPLVTVEVHTPPALPAVGEPEALQGVVRILVDNACRRTSSGSSVTVKAKKAVEGLTVSVTTRGSGGNGEELGLDLARSLVALHGGILWPEPLPAGGTRLLFTLPPKPPALADEEREAAIQALELLAGIGTQPEAAPPVDEALTEEPEERVGDLDMLDAEPDEVDPILDLTDIRDNTAADDDVTPTPETFQSVPEPEACVSAGTEVGPDESEPDVAPVLASQEVDLDLPLDPVDHPSTEEVEAADLEPEPPEESTGIAPEAEPPPTGDVVEVEPQVEPLPAAVIDVEADVDVSEPDLVPEAAVEESVPEPATAKEPADRPGPADDEPEAAEVSVPSDEESRRPSEDEAPSSDDLLEPEPERELEPEPEQEPEPSVLAEAEAGGEEAEEEDRPVEAPLLESDLPPAEEPEEPPAQGPIEVEVTAQVAAGPEEELEGATEAKTPTEAEVASEGPSLRRRWKHRRMKWGRAPQVPRSEDVEPLEEQPEDRPLEAEAPPTGDVLEVEPEPAAPVEPQADVDAATEEPETSEDDPEGPPDHEEPEIPAIEIPDPEPVANATAAVAQEKGPARELPPRPFVPDPFDPATQMLRSLAVDFDGDDAPPDPFRARRER